MHECPAAEKIDDLLAMRLSSAEADELRKHLRGCQTCQKRARGEPIDAPAKSPDPAGRSPDPPADPKPEYDFLGKPQEAGELGRLGKYRVLGVLGEGGMSIVFDAEDTQLRRPVAVKVLRPELVDPTLKHRFLREAKTLASLPHEHIVTVYDYGDHDGVPYIALERLSGESLEDTLKREKTLPPADALKYAREAAEGLMVAHEKGLVHRDIKPANIWLEWKDGRYEGVKLIDFGVARKMTHDSMGLTTFGHIVGTPAYMAPEQAAGLMNVDHRADVYSLGCVLYQMLTGRPVFPDKLNETATQLAAIVAGKVPDVAAENPGLGPAVAALLQEMLARKPEDRPATAAALVERLTRLIDGDTTVPDHPLRAEKPAARPRPRPLFRRRGLVGGVVGAVLALATMGVTYYLLTAKPADYRDALRVGILLSQSGTVAVHERPIISAIQMAIDEINEKGGVLGKRLEPHIIDGKSVEAEFEAGARRLFDEDRVEMIIGCYTSASRKRVAKVCEAADRLLFYPATHEGLEESQHVVYLGGTPNQTVLPLVDWAYEKTDHRTYYLLASENVYGHSVADMLEHEITKRKGRLVGKEFFELDDDRFEDTVEEIAKRKPSMILCALDGNSNAAFAKELRRAGFTPKNLPTVWLSISETELSMFRISEMIGDYSVGCYFETVKGKANEDFLARFRRRSHAAERVNDPMETAYAGVYLYKKAVEKARSVETSAVRAALKDLSIDAPGGPFRIDPNLHAWRRAYVGRIEQIGRLPGFEIVDRSDGLIKPDPFPAWRPRQQWNDMLDGLFKKWNGWEKHRE